MEAFDGTAREYGHGPVRHLGACPTDRFNPDGAPTWTADHDPAAVWYPGFVLRATWPRDRPGAPAADAVPGGRVVVTRATAPARIEGRIEGFDGNSRTYDLFLDEEAARHAFDAEVRQVRRSEHP